MAEQEFTFGGEIVWSPTQDQVESTHLTRFMRQHGIKHYEELLARSTEDLEWFWNAMLQDLEIEFYQGYSKVVDLSAGSPWARWCVGGRMNIVHNLLDKWMGTAVEKRIAVRWEGEEGQPQVWTYGELNRRVCRLANALRRLGLGKGDVAGLFMPMGPELISAFLAVAKIGGVILPLFSGYGSGAIMTRLNDSEAKVLFTTDGVFRRGHKVSLKQTADEALSGCPSVRFCIVSRRTGQDVSWVSGRDFWLMDLCEAQPDSCPTEQTEAEDILMLIYTSGTTGRPKGAVHTHCGFPIKSAQDMRHGLDLQRDDVLFWMTDMGWMMGPWQVFGTLINGSAMFLYDGAPDYPAPDRVWDMVERHGVSILGLSPTFVRAIMKAGDDWLVKHPMPRLRSFASTGEPWNPTAWLWLFHQAGRGKRPIINYSGGTEISGGIVMGNWLSPLKPGAFAGPLPGMAADVVDEQGRPVRGQVGELVIRKPWIGMTRGFWKDPQRYLDTYWSRYPDVWVHGDWAAVDEDGLWYILGRTDDVIKVAGKRLGPAEVESALMRNPAVAEAAAIGVPDEIKGESVVCFAVLKPGEASTPALVDQLRSGVTEELGKALAPKAICFVRDLPKTRNAKIMRRVIRSVYLGRDPGDISSLENPAAVEEIRRVAGQ
ncbi:MAG: AMP-binding protein [Acidobacteriota bacterium]